MRGLTEAVLATGVSGFYFEFIHFPFMLTNISMNIVSLGSGLGTTGLVFDPVVRASATISGGRSCLFQQLRVSQGEVLVL